MSKVATIKREDGVLFGLNIPERVNTWLQAAALKPGDEAWAESNLRRALSEEPEQLEVYMALYKLYCYRGRFDEAEEVTRDVLARAARQAGIPYEGQDGWRGLERGATDWSRYDGPARLMLYSLKALAFIKLRQLRPIESCEILSLLNRIDPEDRVGASVVRDLLAGIGGGER